MAAAHVTSERVDTRLNESQSTVGSRTAYIVWVEDFIFAGSSAMLLLIANLFSAYWFLSFMALIAFIHRASRSSPRGALRVGMLFGVVLFANAEIISLMVQPQRAVLDIVVGTMLCSVLGWCIRWSRGHRRVSPLILPLIWVVFQFALTKLAGMASLFANIEIALPAFQSLSVLFGPVVVSPIIVLANTMLLWIVERASASAGDWARILSGSPRGMRLETGSSVRTCVASPAPYNRAPPLTGRVGAGRSAQNHRHGTISRFGKWKTENQYV